ncbi:MAG: GIY-YIG nuclease family protein [Bdellovibrionales bacterium]|nr:GIY-YIG nuclease family protein [Bdellovibrionales bacterium]
MYVYLIRSINSPNQIYIGRTQDFSTRLKSHNQGSSKHSSKYRPWELEVLVYFKNHELGIKFEKYLKSGSGRAFSKRRFGV